MKSVKYRIAPVAIATFINFINYVYQNLDFPLFKISPAGL